ncbi:hypothetical protein BDZ97DRAFT_489010 [Flammula alnicola]|nr:hypothetical protein BDZ97DRAFT_489010 [Flammula alnicola]
MRMLRLEVGIMREKRSQGSPRARDQPQNHVPPGNADPILFGTIKAQTMPFISRTPGNYMVNRHYKSIALSQCWKICFFVPGLGMEDPWVLMLVFPVLSVGKYESSISSCTTTTTFTYFPFYNSNCRAERSGHTDTPLSCNRSVMGLINKVE